MELRLAVRNVHVVIIFPYDARLKDSKRSARGNQDVTTRKMSLSILLGALQPWLLGAVTCTVTLLIVALLMLRRGQLRKQAQPEVEKVSTPPQVDPPSEEVKVGNQNTTT